MPKLILVRHSLPEIVPELPASQWHLSQEGRLRCRPLAERLAAYDVDAVIASVEPKAAETGRIVAERLAVPFETVPGLHEHERNSVTWMGQERFVAAVADLFGRPEELVMGEETASQAQRRFAAAVDGAVSRRPGESLVVATHGTVMTLFVARATGIAPFPFWQRLTMPCYAVLSLPGLELLEVVVDIGTDL